MSELLELVERCEKASGPDRELDAAIAYQHQGYWRKNEGHPLGRQCCDTHGIAVELPRYTASLDAAMTLVTEGRLWTMDSWSGSGWSAGIWHPGSPHWLLNSDKDRQQRTPALALTAAALRARSTQP